MPPVENIEHPHFVIDQDATDDVARRLRILERRINDNPTEFQTALMALGDLAALGTIELDQRDQRQATLKRKPKDMLTEFFQQRYDVEMSFDEATEDAIAGDGDFLALRDEMQGKKSLYMRKGVMGSFSRPNEEALPVREKIRRYRLELYIGRVAATKAAQMPVEQTATARGKLRSTG